MKKLVMSTLMFMFLVSSAMAATSTVSISASVLGTCTINGGSISFGNLDPAGAGVVNGAIVDAQVNCTNGAPYTIADDDGLNELGLNGNRLTDGSGNYMDYSFNYTSTGLGTGALVNIGLSSTINADALGYLNKPAGAYSDTVTLTVLP